jgi:hypothetical protein
VTVTVCADRDACLDRTMAERRQRRGEAHMQRLSDECGPRELWGL